ncbi:MAG TPA: flagellar biosynthetic protein FliO [Bryobacteraceae bacterium]|nr:flagellar biosynthetic protein FliO [Bryobacteraceae bacterium]
MDVIRQSLAITFVFLLLWAALWFLRKRRGISLSSGRAAKGLMESRGKLALSAQHALHLVRIGDRELVLALHPSGVTLVCDVSRSSPAHSVPLG